MSLELQYKAEQIVHDILAGHKSSIMTYKLLYREFPNPRNIYCPAWKLFEPLDPHLNLRIVWALALEISLA